MSPDGSHVSARSAESGEGSNGSGGIELIKAEYHKKDVTMWLPFPSNAATQTSAAKADTSKDRNSTKRSALGRVSENHPSSFATDGQSTKENETNEQDQVCARVQVWDATGQDSFASQETDDSEVHDKARKDAIISGADFRWSQIFRNAAGALIVCTLSEEEGDAGGTHAGQHLDRQSIMDHLERRIARWLALVDAFTSQSSSADEDNADNIAEERKKHRIPVTLIVNKSDQISNVLSSSDWVRVGAQMERLCERSGIDGGWYTSTCLDPRSGKTAQDSPTSASASVSSGAWNEDHDGAEMAFLSLVRSNLLAKRESISRNNAGSGNDGNANAERRKKKSPNRKKKGNRKQSPRRSRSSSRPRPRAAAPNFPIDP